MVNNTVELFNYINYCTEESNNTSTVRLVWIIRGKMTAAVLKLVRTHGHAGSTPPTATQGIVGTGISVQLVWFLLWDGAQPAYPTDRLAHHLPRWTAHHWIVDASFKSKIQYNGTTEEWFLMHKHYWCYKNSALVQHLVRSLWGSFNYSERH